VQALAWKMGSSCRFTGWLSASGVERLFARAGLMLVPREYEPFGMVALEAMRAGAAKTGGLAEVACPGSGAILVDSHDPREWLESAIAVLENHELSSVLRCRGPPWTTRHFSEIKIASQLLRCVYAS
jgi:glycosyltransferase involved in cell wall biosynthesis